MPKEAPKIDPFQDGEALDLTNEVAEQESTQQTPAEGAEPAQQAEPQQQQPETTTKPEQAVPYPRFKEVIDARTAAEKRATDIAKERDELKERWARMDERQKQLREANEYATQQAAQQRQTAERPDPTIDPTGAEIFDLKQQAAQDRANYQALQQQVQQSFGNVQQNQVQQEHSNWIQFQAQSYAQQDPQYFEKATKAANWRMGFWEKLGLTHEEAIERVQAESMLITADARKKGINFAPVIAELADVLDIWEQRRNAGANGNGQVRQNGGTNGSARLQQVAAGQRVQGLSHIPGGSGANEKNFLNMSLAELSDISEADHSRLMADQGINGRQYRAALRRADGVEDNYGGRL